MVIKMCTTIINWKGFFELVINCPVYLLYHLNSIVPDFLQTQLHKRIFESVIPVPNVTLVAGLK